MGRDWYWGGGGKTSSTPAKKEDVRETPGCMSGVLHLFDFHQFQFPISQPPCFKPNSILQEDPTSTKGAEAPRNSLESDEGITMGASVSKQKLIKIPVEEIRVVKTTSIDHELSCSDSNSPGPKTPSLVARLMGLDLLPDTLSSSSSPSSSSRRKQIHTKSNQKTKTRRNENTGSRSLPDTPRVSSSSRRSDVDARFSLQINKENMMELDYFSHEKVRRDQWLKNEEDCRSPGHYARQIVKQVKESVSRRVGLDITNTTHNSSSSRLKSKDVEEVVILKSKKPKRLTKIGEESKSTLNSPRLRLRDQDNNKNAAAAAAVAVAAAVADQVSVTPKPLPKPCQQTNPRRVKQKTKPQSMPQHQTIEKCKKASCERFTQRKEVSVVRGSKQDKKNCKNSTTRIESSPSTSSSAHVQPIRCSEFSSNASRVSSSLNDPTDFADEIRYTSEILKCTGVHKYTLVSFTGWYSPSHPLDPSIFHHLENFQQMVGPLKHRCNRRLIFSFIDELLASFIKPYINIKPWQRNDHRCFRKQMHGDELLQYLIKEIKQSPLSNCQTLEDIDNLIDRDLVRNAKMHQTLPVFEESESIVFEIEQDILDSLVHETAAEALKNGNRGRKCV